MVQTLNRLCHIWSDASMKDKKTGETIQCLNLMTLILYPLIFFERWNSWTLSWSNCKPWLWRDYLLLSEFWKIRIGGRIKKTWRVSRRKADYSTFIQRTGMGCSILYTGWDSQKLQPKGIDKWWTQTSWICRNDKSQRHTACDRFAYEKNCKWIHHECTIAGVTQRVWSEAGKDRITSRPWSICS